MPERGPRPEITAARCAAGRNARVCVLRRRAAVRPRSAATAPAADPVRRPASWFRASPGARRPSRRSGRPASRPAARPARRCPAPSRDGPRENSPRSANATLDLPPASPDADAHARQHQRREAAGKPAQRRHHRPQQHRQHQHVATIPAIGQRGDRNRERGVEQREGEAAEAGRAAYRSRRTRVRIGSSSRLRIERSKELSA